VLLLFVALQFSNSVRADSSAGTGKSSYSPEVITGFARTVEQALASRGARVVILARQGRPDRELPEGIKFTHTGFAVYSEITLANGSTVPGYAIYNLYRDANNLAHSALVRDFPMDFFRNVATLRAGVIIPSAPVQRLLLKFIATEKYQAIHNAHYSLMSNPLDGASQNCTEFTLDVINAVVYDTTDRAQLKLDAERYFAPQLIPISRATLTVASLFRRELDLSDHDGPVATATFETLAAYMAKYKLSSTSFIVTSGGIVEEMASTL